MVKNWFGKKELSKQEKKQKKATENPIKHPSWVVPVLVTFILIQLILPLRHHLIPGQTDWTGEGQRFAWRMKIFHKEIEVCKFTLYNLDKREFYPITIERYLNSDQLQQMAFDPEMLHRFAQHIGDEAMTVLKYKNVMVKADVKVALNGRPSEFIFSNDLDLYHEEWKKSGHNEWLNPIPEYTEE